MVMWSGSDSLLNNIWTYKETRDRGDVKGTSVIGFIRAACLLLVQEGENKQKLIFFKENKNQVAIETWLISMSSRGKHPQMHWGSDFCTRQTERNRKSQKRGNMMLWSTFLYIPMRSEVLKELCVRLYCCQLYEQWSDVSLNCALTTQHFPSTTTTYLVLLHV